MEGNVKWFNRSKGYGFIEGDDGVQYFVHNSQLKETRFIRENDRVSFDGVETEKGKQAQNVKLMQKGSERSDVEQKPRSERAPKNREESEDDFDESEEDSEEESGEDSEDF